MCICIVLVWWDSLYVETYNSKCVEEPPFPPSFFLFLFFFFVKCCM